MTIVGISLFPPVSRTADTAEYPRIAVDTRTDQQIIDRIGLGRRAYDLMHAGIAHTLPDLAGAMNTTEDEVTAGIVAFLREETGNDLSDPVTTAACPAWCTRTHTTLTDTLTEARECATAAAGLPTLSHSSIAADCVQLVDLCTGRVYPPEVRIGDDTITPAVARLLAAQIIAAADIAEQTHR